jgi:tRNA/rRNA methyltransferase
MREQLKSGSVAILFGSEKTGLGNKDLSYCQWLLRIPTRQQHGSMNLGQAVAVCLYELIREDRRSSRETTPRQADAADLDRVTALLLESARASGYLSAQSESSSEEKIRRLVFRLGLPADDVSVWLGMLRQSLWRMKR